MHLSTVRFLYLICGSIFFTAAVVVQDGLKLGKTPAALFRIDTSFNGLSWQKIIDAHFRSFSNPDTSNESLGGYATQSTFGIYFPLEQSYEKREKFHNTVVKKFYQSPAAQKALYYWVKDHYLKEWKKLHVKRQKCFEDMLRHAKTYMDNFNFTGELTLYNKELEGGKGASFAFWGPRGRRGEFGRMEAFICRRLFRKELTMAQMKAWVKIAIADLEAEKKKH